MPSYNENEAARLKHLAALAQKTASVTFQSVAVSGSAVNFKNAAGTVIGTFDFPEELYLNQTGTQLVENFAFSSATYPGATNPNLDGKTVLVLAVKGDKNTVKYSFVDMAKVIKAISAGDNSITINGYAVSVKISAETGNLLELESDGLFVGSDDTKVDKVAGVTGNVVNFGASGAIVDSGVQLSDKVDKVTAAVSGNIVTFGTGGAIIDSGVTFASDSDVEAMINQYFPTVGGGNG